MSKLYTIVFSSFLSVLTLFACTSNRPEILVKDQSIKLGDNQPDYSTPYYRILDPVWDPQKDFEHAKNVIKRIQTTTYYTTYFFDSDQHISRKILQFQKVQKLSRNKRDFVDSGTGTAIALTKSLERILLITCDHVVDANDTIYVYRDNKLKTFDSPLKSVSILNKVDYLLFDSPELSSFTVLATEPENDLALIVGRLPDNKNNPYYIETLKFELGTEKRMRWGSIIYAFGFPMGFKMMTKGLVSDPQKESHFYILSDIQFNPGISGGLVLAINGETNKFEWVGLASSASSTAEFVLSPKTNALNEQEDFQIYTDTIFVQRKKNINYGITRSVKATIVKDFLKKSKKAADGLGLDVTKFYNDDTF